MRWLAAYETYPTKTDESISVAFKLLAIKWINFVWIPIFVSGMPQNWFKAKGLAGTIRALIIVTIWTPPVLYALNLGKYWKAWRIRVIRGKGDAQVKLNQAEANAMMEGGKIDPANVVSDYFKFFCVCVFYSPMVPAAIPGCVLGTATFYWTLKYKLLRRVKTPDMLSENLAVFFSNLLPFVVFGQCFGIVVLYGAMALFNSTEWQKINKEFVVTPATILRDDEIKTFFLRPIKGTEVS